MGLFDFFKNKKDTSDTSAKNTLEGNNQHTLKYKMQLNERDLNAEKKTIKSVVDKMIEEDPFKNYYSGKAKEDMRSESERNYK